MWRGYKVRKILIEYLYEFAKNYENIQEDGEEEEEVEQDEKFEEVQDINNNDGELFNTRNTHEGKISFDGDEFKQHRKEIDDLFTGKKEK